MKKIVSVLLCVMLCASAFSACSKQVEIREMKITYDARLSDYSDEAKNAYTALFNAVMNCEESAEVGEEVYDEATTMFYTSFPLSDLVDSIKQNSDSKSVRIRYKNSSKEHKRLVEKFKKEASVILDDCKAGTASDNELILNLYSFLAQNVEIDYSRSTAYDAIVEKKGSSSAFEAAFNFLLQQEGIPAARVYAKGYDATHFLTELEINGEKYYFDPCGEKVYSQGKGLSYFGMTYMGLQKNGIECDLTFADKSTAVPEQNSDMFAGLFQTKSYEYSNSVISATHSDGQITEISF